MVRRDRLLLQKISDEMFSIENFVHGLCLDTFLEDEKTQKAICMTLLNIGEMVKVLSEEIKQKSPSISWRRRADVI